MVSRYFYDDNVTEDTNAPCLAAKVSHFLDTVLAVMLPYPTLPYHTLPYPAEHGKYSERRKFHICNDLVCTSFTDTIYTTYTIHTI